VVKSNIVGKSSHRVHKEQRRHEERIGKRLRPGLRLGLRKVIADYVNA